MNATWPPFTGWLLHSAVGGGLLLLLALPLMRACRQPARRQRLGESALLAALVLCILNLGPSWITLPSATFSIRPELPLAAAQPAENLVIPQPESEMGLRAGRDLDNPEALDDADALTRSLLEAISLAVDPAVNDASQETTQPGSSDSAPGIALALPSPTLSRWLALAALAYAAVSALLLGRWLLGHFALWRLLRDAQPAPEAVNHVFETMACGRGRQPRLLVSRRLRVPLSCGLIRPCVVLPANLCESNAAETLRWLFAHELTHLERGDAWTCLLFGLGQVLYFCLPWFWWLRRQVRLCQEYIADAVAAEQAANPEDYAQFLVSLTRAPAVPLGALGVLGNSSDLFRRVTMLLQTPIPVEKRCPRWWSLAAAGGLLVVALVVSGIGLRADAAPAAADTPTGTVLVDETEKPDPAEKPAQAKRAGKTTKTEAGEEPAEKKDSKKWPAMEKVLRDLEELLKDLPSALDADQVKHLQEQLKETQKEMEQALERLKKEVGSGKLEVLRKHLPELPADFLHNVDLRLKAEEALNAVVEMEFSSDGKEVFVRRCGGRLGVQVQKPGAVLADQLNLPKGQGLVIEHVVPDSAAAKAGLKAHDVLLEFNGKPVPAEAAKFIKMVEEVKANTPVDAVVLRKGRKETIKGISLAETKTKQPFEFKAVPGAGQAPFKIERVPNTHVQRYVGPGSHSVITTMFRSKDSFNTRSQEGSLIITVTGSVTDGKSKVKQIEIQDGGKSETYESIDKVPEQYRDKVKNLIEMSEKNNLKIEVGANSVSPVKDKHGLNPKLIVKNWKIGPLKHANAKDMYDLIKDIYREHINNTLSLLQSSGKPNMFYGPNGQLRGVDLSISYDERTNAVFLSCNQIMYEEIKRLVDGIESDTKHLKPSPPVRPSDEGPARPSDIDVNSPVLPQSDANDREQVFSFWVGFFH